MLIALTGRAGAGKDTVAEALHALFPHWPYRRVSFADKLKDSACAALGITRWLMEDWKRTDQDCINTPWGSLTMRVFLERYGTEAHRNIFGTDFWVKQALPDDLEHAGSLLVVTDCRFPNEAAQVRALTGRVFEVIGPEGPADSALHQHASRRALPQDALAGNIYNNLHDPEQLRDALLHTFPELALKP